MKVKFLKDHLDNKKAEIKDVEYGQGRYFINTGVAELAEGESGESPAKKATAKTTTKKATAKTTTKKTNAKKAPAKKASKEVVENKELKPDLENK